MTDRNNIENQLEILQAKYIGTGHSDITRWDWGNNMKRDTLNSHIQNPSRLNLFSICENLPQAVIKRRLLEKMVLPLGKKPILKEEENNIFK